MTKEEFLDQRKNEYNYETPSIVSKIKHNHKMLKIGFMFTAIILSAIIGIMFIKIVEQRKEETKQAKIIENLKYQNISLKQKTAKAEKLVKYYQKDNKRLARNLRNTKSNKRTRNLNIKPKNTKRTKTYAKPKTYTTNKTRTNTYKKPKTNKPTKRYIRYSGYKDLVSDSTITTRNDNRFKSNASIYGRYNNRAVNVDCDLEENIYHVVDECSAIVKISLDKIYFKKSNAGIVRNYNTNSHMIECLYNQEYGLMHDCKVKMRSI